MLIWFQTRGVYNCEIGYLLLEHLSKHNFNGSYSLLRRPSFPGAGTFSLASPCPLSIEAAWASAIWPALNVDHRRYGIRYIIDIQPVKKELSNSLFWFFSISRLVSFEFTNVCNIMFTPLSQIRLFGFFKFHCLCVLKKKRITIQLLETRCH